LTIAARSFHVLSAHHRPARAVVIGDENAVNALPPQTSGFRRQDYSGAHAMSELLYRACVVTLWLCPIAIAVIVLFM
jgi:hypothetical protein